MYSQTAQRDPDQIIRIEVSMRATTDKELMQLGAGLIGLDLMFNDGKWSKYLAERAFQILGKSAVKIVYVPVTEEDLVDCSFGC